MMKQLPKHENIIGFIDAEIMDNQALILMELCEGGTLADLMRKYIKVKFKEE